MFTVDVEDWFHPLIKDPSRWDQYEDRIERPCERLLALLESSGNRGTFFVLGWVAERHPDLVRRILAGGHEVGCHGHHHLSLAWIDPDRFRDDLARSLDALRAAGATDVVSFRAPYFSINRRTEWALPILAAHGLRIDSSIFPLKLGYYGQHAAPNTPHRRGPLTEYPITLPEFGGVRLPITGGFYSRFFPAAWSLAGIRRVFEAGSEPMFYVHPWELDPTHPRIRVGRFLTYRHYVRLERTEQIIAAILERWQWRSIRERDDACMGDT
jgi:polysaccharide deacetylase family protein (PEP-CTERM system associated)